MEKSNYSEKPHDLTITENAEDNDIIIFNKFGETVPTSLIVTS